MRMKTIDLNLLRVFDAILRTGSVRQAAERVGLSKPATSHALARLRSQLDDDVLVRSGHAWILTERARAAAPRVHALLEEAAMLLGPADPLDAPKLHRQFSISLNDHALSILGVAIGHAVSAEAPSVSLRFLPPLSDDASALRSREIDLAVGVFPELPANFRTQRLLREKLVCVVRTAWREAPQRLSLQSFVTLRHVLISPRGKGPSVVDEALAELGLQRRVARSVPYFLSALDLVSKSDCITTVPERLARLHARRFGLRVLQPPLELPTHDTSQIWHPQSDSDPAHRWIRRVVLQAAKTHRSPGKHRSASTA